MDKALQKLSRLGLDLASLGVERRNDGAPYFCTPKGASIFGWTGVDGIHFCFVRGFGSMVFAVSPTNSAPEYVHPLAQNFTDFLRLLLACGDAAALEQAWMWDQAQFDSFLLETPPTPEQEHVLTDLREKMHLTAMEQPWTYIKDLQNSFDYRRLRYTDDCCPSEKALTSMPSFSSPWEVFFDGSFWGHSGRDRPGKEIPVGVTFHWAEHDWLIPAAYSCGKGLVLDFCMRVEPEDIRAFIRKWRLTHTGDLPMQLTPEQQLEMELEHPLQLAFTPTLELNGQTLQFSHGCSECFSPLPEAASCHSGGPVRQIMAHYGLDDTYGWVLFRSAFPWRYTRRPVIRSLSLIMTREPVQLPGPHFKLHAPGDTFSFSHPISRKTYTLTVQELEPQTLPKELPNQVRCFFPKHFVSMSYSLSPDPEPGIEVLDCEEGDHPLEIFPEDSPLPSDMAACVGIIGGADGPTVLVHGDHTCGTLHTAHSALHFEPISQDVQWRLVFHVRKSSPLTLALL